MNIEKINLGGSVFRPIRISTLEHDHWCMTEIRAAGLDRITMTENETPDEFTRRLLNEVIATKRIYPLLGSLMVPDALKDEEWTPDIAVKTGDFIRKLTSPEDKAKINTIVVEMLIGFFANGLATVMIFRSSMNAGASPEVESEEKSAATISATGGSSSENSATTTRKGILRSFAGLFGKR